MGFPKVEDFIATKDEFEYSAVENILRLVPTSCIIVGGIFVHKKLFIFLAKDTCVNRIVRFQSKMNLIFIPLVICFGAIQEWLQEVGPNHILCYIFSYMINFVFVSIQSHSFFITMFRYLFIVKTDKILKHVGTNAHKVNDLLPR